MQSPIISLLSSFHSSNDCNMVYVNSIIVFLFASAWFVCTWFVLHDFMCIICMFRMWKCMICKCMICMCMICVCMICMFMLCTHMIGICMNYICMICREKTHNAAADELRATSQKCLFVGLWTLVGVGNGLFRGRGKTGCNIYWCTLTSHKDSHFRKIIFDPTPAGCMAPRNTWKLVVYVKTLHNNTLPYSLCMCIFETCKRAH